VRFRNTPRLDTVNNSAPPCSGLVILRENSSQVSAPSCAPVHRHHRFSSETVHWNQSAKVSENRLSWTEPCPIRKAQCLQKLATRMRQLGQCF